MDSGYAVKIRRFSFVLEILSEMAVKQTQSHWCRTCSRGLATTFSSNQLVSIYFGTLNRMWPGIVYSSRSDDDYLADTNTNLHEKQTTFSFAALLALGLTFTACKNDDNPVTASTTTRFTATLNGASEKPASTTSPATGTFVGDLNTTTRVMSYTVNFQGFPANDPPTGGHLHKITMADGTGPVDIPFKSLISPIMETSAVLRQTQVDSIMKGLYYANMHTNTFKGGAIRGEVKKQ